MDSDLTVFIDEGGDSGIRDGLHYAQAQHEWFSLGALLIRTSRERDMDVCLDKIKDECRVWQSPTLHYYKLKEDRRAQACEILSTKPIQAFCVVSNKTNMREYVNPNLGKMSSNEFYNWCTRILLERVMDRAERFYKKEGIPVRPLKIIFSENQAINYDALFGYLDMVNSQESNGRPPKLRSKKWEPKMMQRNMWSVVPHGQQSGLQLVDLVASAFLQAVNLKAPNFDQKSAMALSRVIAKGADGSRANIGVTLLPFKHQAQIPNGAKPIFEHFGYIF